MYYSKRGVSFDRNYAACNRYSKVAEIFEDVNLEELVRTINFMFRLFKKIRLIYYQVATAALLLRDEATYVRVNDDGIKEYAKYVAEAYIKKRGICFNKGCKDFLQKYFDLFLDEILQKYNTCEKDFNKKINRLMFTIVLDGSLNLDESQRMIA